MKVLTIIVTYNGMRWAERCIGSVVASAMPSDIIVVDNGSTDGTAAFIREHFPSVEVLEDGSNPGFGAANNKGLCLALERGYDFVYLLNQDAWIERGTIGTLVGAMRPPFGILSPLQKNADGRTDALFARHVGRLGTETKEVRFVMAAHWLLSREAIAAVGGFSPAFHQYGEDENYIHRLHYHGLKCGVVPGAEAVHDRGGRKFPREKRMRMKSLIGTVKVSDPCRCLPLSLILEPLELFGMGIKNHSLTILRAIPNLVRRYPELIRLRRISGKRGAFLD